MKCLNCNKKHVDQTYLMPCDLTVTELLLNGVSYLVFLRA